MRYRSHNTTYRRRSSPLALFILGAICLVAGPVVGFVGYSDMTEAKALQTTGQRVQGEVIGSLKKSGGRRSSSKTELTVSFTSPDGKEMSGDKSVAGAVYERYKVEHDGDIAKTCTVVYDAASGKWNLEDQLSENISTGNNMMIGGPLGGLVLALILMGSGFAAKKRREAEAAVMMQGYGTYAGQPPHPYPQAPQAYPQAAQPYPQAPQAYPPQQPGMPQQPYAPYQGMPPKPPYSPPQQGYPPRT